MSDNDPLRTFETSRLSLGVEDDPKPFIEAWNDEVAGEQIKVCITYLILVRSAGVTLRKTLLTNRIIRAKVVKLVVGIGRLEQLAHPSTRRRCVRLKVQDHGQAAL